MGFDDVSLQKYGQSSYEHCYVHQWGVLWGVFQNVPNSRAVVTLFGGEWLLWILMVFHYKSMVSSSYNNYCYVHQWVCYKGVKFEIKFEKKMGFNET